MQNDVVSRAPKKAKTKAANHTKKLKGKLANLPSMPWDILFEIFRLLLPIDILHLARTSKSLRRVLMNKSSMSVWKSAISNVPGFPGCPTDMTIPAYISLAFDTHCDICLAKTNQNVEWMLRVRFCKKCAKGRFLYLETCFPPDEMVLDTMYYCVPFSYQELLDEEDYMTRPGDSYCLESDHSEFSKAYENNEYDDWDSYTIKRQKQMDKRRKHAQRCRSWADSLAKARALDIEKKIENREEFIIDKLVALGYEDELDKCQEEHDDITRIMRVTLFHEHPLVKAAKPITDRSWRTIERRMVQYMEDMKVLRSTQDNHKIVTDRRVTAMKLIIRNMTGICTTDILPTVADFLIWENVKGIIDCPLDVVVNASSFKDIIARLPELVEEWRRTNMQDLITRNRIDDDVTPIDVENYDYHMKRLKLAVSIFSCPEASQIHEKYEHDTPKPHLCMWYPEFIHHGCNWIEKAETHKGPVKDFAVAARITDPLLRLSSYKFKEGFKRKPWSSTGLVFDRKASRVAKKVVAACGLNPEEATVEDMDKLDARVVCLRCSFKHKPDGERSMEIRTWRQAVYHCLKTHFGDANVQWQRISENDENQARLSAKKESSRSGAEDDDWMCVHCRGSWTGGSTTSLYYIKRHCTDMHRIRPPKKDRDYCKSFQLPPPQPSIIKMVPEKV